MSRALIIAGFHRSGTSLTTRLLHAAGLFIGDELLGALPSNPYGHFEDSEVVGLHDGLLKDNGLRWQLADPIVPYVDPTRWEQLQDLVQRRHSAHALWGFKDPRVCLFLPMWKHVVPDARVLIVFRHYADCAHSLERRHAEQLVDAFGPPEVHRRFWEEPDLALRMWLNYNAPLLRFAARYPQDVHVVSFAAIRSGYGLVEALRRRWDLPLRPTSALEVFDPTITRDRTHPQPIVDRGLGGRLEQMLFRLRHLEQASRERT